MIPTPAAAAAVCVPRVRVTPALRRRRHLCASGNSWPAGLNQADHRVAGLAALDALRDAGNRWVFRELLAEGLEPWSTRWLLVAGDTSPTHGVDVSGEALERGIASLEAHGAYLAGFPGHPPPRLLLTAITAMQGPRMGVSHAVLFRAFDFDAPPPIALAAMRQGDPGTG